MGMRREGRWRRFDWRVAEITTCTLDFESRKVHFVVQQRSVIFGLPLWWQTYWNYNTCDGVNYDDKEFHSLDEAKAYMESEAKLRSYFKKKRQSLRAVT